MPKGSKKRKAAQKKKQQDALLSTNPLGNDDLKTQEEKHSDGGELGSPAYQDDHQGQHPFGDAIKEVEKKESPSFGTFGRANKPFEEVKEGDVEGVQEYGSRGSDVEIYKESNNEEDSEITNITLQQVESAKESQNGKKSSSSSSSSSSSGEDSEVAIDKKTVKEKIFNSVVESPQIDDSVKLLESFAEDKPVEEIYNSTTEDVPVIEENLMVSDAVHPGLMENGEKSLPEVAEAIGVTSALMDFKSKKVDEMILPSADDNASSSAVECTLEEKEVKPLPSPVIASAGTSNGAEHMADSEFPESSESKPLVASAPRAVQKTSWMSCCGLFEVLTHSS